MVTSISISDLDEVEEEELVVGVEDDGRVVGVEDDGGVTPSSALPSSLSFFCIIACCCRIGLGSYASSVGRSRCVVG